MDFLPNINVRLNLDILLIKYVLQSVDVSSNIDLLHSVCPKNIDVMQSMNVLSSMDVPLNMDGLPCMDSLLKLNILQLIVIEKYMDILYIKDISKVLMSEKLANV